jgi:hypothetical protein
LILNIKFGKAVGAYFSRASIGGVHAIIFKLGQVQGPSSEF